MPETRTMKNSSRLELKMARNFILSMSGLSEFSASSSTRRLNSSQLNSRLTKLSGAMAVESVLSVVAMGNVYPQLGKKKENEGKRVWTRFMVS